uniref:Uncharacterized protein n=1 Tax=uncultured Armatimonadetes bacterium TaxID=157466 RepID=A0A6J4HU03_9BACT|nr:hypothetical protein AVDCRST_MAG63-1050 [uncultured Armatimonadetes bacterium]
MSKRRMGLLGIAGGVLIVLLLLPATGWLVRAQLWMSTGASARSYDPAASGRRHARAAALHPDDLPLQMAYALQRGEASANDDAVVRLRPLLPRGGDEPVLHAAILRFSTAGAVVLWRDEQHLLSASPPAVGTTRRAVPTSANRPETLAAFDASARAGERLDPDNAFFPLMRAVGLMAAGRDGEAIAAVLHAGQKGGWNDYVAETVEGRWRLNLAANGEPGALARTAQFSAELLPHFAVLRSLVRVATVKAIEAERAGHTDEGFAIRRAITRCGAAMRVHSSSYIGSLVGSAISATASTRPGGAPAISEEDGEEQGRKRVAAYRDYLVRSGHGEEGRYFAEEDRMRSEMRAIYTKAEASTEYGLGSLRKLAAWWGTGLLTLVSALWLVAGGVAASLIFRFSARVQDGRPMSPGARRGAVVGLAAAPVCLGLLPPESWWWLAVSLTGAAAIGVAFASRRGRDALPGWRAFATSGAAVAASGMAVTRQANGATAFWIARTDPSAGSTVGADGVTMLLMTALVLAVPLFLLCVGAVISRIVRVPVSVGLARGLRRLAVPGACVLLIVYGGIATATARMEARMRDAVAQQVRHEGRYYAGIAGAAWPGFASSHD